MAQTDIAIIGGGAAGLNAARELVRRNLKVTVLEARDRLGGRIHTISNSTLPIPVELGAEFVHGNLPLTLSLLNEAGIEYYEMEGETWQVKKNKVSDDFNYFDHQRQFMKRLSGLKEDMTIDDFLSKYFSDNKYNELRDSIRGFVEGFDSADPSLACASALRDEWLNEEDSAQYRIKGGYGKLIESLNKNVLDHSGNVELNFVVKEIKWNVNEVQITSADGKVITAKKALITVPLGILVQNSINFIPAIPEKMKAAGMIGYGAVIKVLLYFDDSFWQLPELEKRLTKKMHDIAFIFSEAPIPTWWTQSPEKTPLLTGWLAGPKADRWKTWSNDLIFQQALESLSSIFEMQPEEIKSKVRYSKVVNWTADPFTAGAYSYATLETHDARNILLEPVDNTLFFAGEALHASRIMGTVEAALVSGREAAIKMVPAGGQHL